MIFHTVFDNLLFRMFPCRNHLGRRALSLDNCKWPIVQRAAPLAGISDCAAFIMEYDTTCKEFTSAGGVTER
jgi:hypothetical protein